ncbi:SGNH/GDSL hydrolase family protein [Pseudarthrobacter phenanthrenivorans]|nr:SGNH/GDSL hydrolase family protein [Pseudarthrobacter phenanthrenivorans]
MAMGFTAIPADAAPQTKAEYVALGDSYTAGTGAGAAERPLGVDCWQSTPGYVNNVAKTGNVNLAANAACHGAVLSRFSPFYDQVLLTPTVHEQIDSLVMDGRLSGDTDLVSITAGANDLGFAYVLGVCAFYSDIECQGAVAQATSGDSLALLTGGLVQTYRTIRAVAPNSQITALGYPLLFDPNSSFAPLPAAKQMLINQATLVVNSTIANAAAAADVQYVDVTGRFAGHEVNSSDPWLQLSPTDFTADYNFHPTPEGHRAYAAGLLAAVKPGQLARR